MARYIDADLLIKELKELQGLHSPSMSKVANEAIDLGLSLAMRTARKAPTADVVEVVRCKDCGSFNKHYKECTLHGSHFGENGFCCKGKKMERKNDFKE